MTSDIAGREARHGEKMIEITLRFWTNDIAEAPGNVVPKHCHSSGMMWVARNEAHGITGERPPKPFNSLMEIPSVIEQTLIKEGIKMYPSSKMKRYLRPAAAR